MKDSSREIKAVILAEFDRSGLLLLRQKQELLQNNTQKLLPDTEALVVAEAPVLAEAPV